MYTVDDRIVSGIFVPKTTCILRICMVLAHTTYCVSVLRCLDLDKGSNTAYCVSVLCCLDLDKGSNTIYCVLVLRCLDLDKGSNTT